MRLRETARYFAVIVAFSLLASRMADADTGTLLRGVDSFMVSAPRFNDEARAEMLGLTGQELYRAIAGAVTTEGLQLNQGRFDAKLGGIVDGAPNIITTNVYLSTADRGNVTWSILLGLQADVRSLDCTVSASAVLWQRVRFGSSSAALVPLAVRNAVDEVMTELVVDVVLANRKKEH